MFVSPRMPLGVLVHLAQTSLGAKPSCVLLFQLRKNEIPVPCCKECGKDKKDASGEKGVDSMHLLITQIVLGQHNRLRVLCLDSSRSVFSVFVFAPGHLI